MGTDVVNGSVNSVRKETNPKDAVGVKKVPISTVSAIVVAEMGLGMLEGARKYGRHNYRIAGVRASVYYDAAMRHLMAWWEGQDIDPDSGLPHIVKALSTLAVLRDAMHNNKMKDDRPPSLLDPNWIAALNAKAAEIIERYPTPVEPYTIEYVSPEDMKLQPMKKGCRHSLSTLSDPRDRTKQVDECCFCHGMVPHKPKRKHL